MGQQSTLVRKGEIPTPPHIRDISPSIATQNYHRLVAKLWGVDVELLSSISYCLAVIWLIRSSKSGFPPFFCRFSRFFATPTRKWACSTPSRMSHPFRWQRKPLGSHWRRNQPVALIFPKCPKLPHPDSKVTPCPKTPLTLKYTLINVIKWEGTKNFTSYIWCTGSGTGLFGSKIFECGSGKELF